MFEGVVAAVLNRFLGKYVQDLDTENLNVGIFGGDVQLHNLRIRPEALVSNRSGAPSGRHLCQKQTMSSIGADGCGFQPLNP